LDVADEVCSSTNGQARHSQTWWWNDELAEFISKKRRFFRIVDKFKNDVYRVIVELNRKRYQSANGSVNMLFESTRG